MGTRHCSDVLRCHMTTVWVHKRKLCIFSSSNFTALLCVISQLTPHDFPSPPSSDHHHHHHHNLVWTLGGCYLSQTCHSWSRRHLRTLNCAEAASSITIPLDMHGSLLTNHSSYISADIFPKHITRLYVDPFRQPLISIHLKMYYAGLS